jgi:hypothetical protein
MKRYLSLKSHSLKNSWLMFLLIFESSSKLIRILDCLKINYFP